VAVGECLEHSLHRFGVGRLATDRLRASHVRDQIWVMHRLHPGEIAGIERVVPFFMTARRCAVRSTFGVVLAICGSYLVQG